MREQGRREAAIEADQQEVEQTEEEAPKVRFVGGAIPPVQTADNEDPRIKELKQKVGRLVDENFAGEYRRAFDHYDSDHDGKMTKDEIKQMLGDAGVGNGLTRGAWADGILKKLDMDHDRGVTWGEFDSAFKIVAQA